MPNISNLKDHTEKLTQISSERVEKFYAFVKTILTISSGMVAVLVSLKKENTAVFDKLIFTSAIGCLSLGILCASYLLYTEVKSLRHLEDSLTKHITDIIDGTSNNNLWIEAGNPGSFFKISKFGMTICFLSALALLTIYSY